MADFVRPTPIQLLYDMEVHYLEKGKAYNENAMRDYVNAEFEANGWSHPDLPLLPVANPKIIPEDPRRAELIRREDRDAMAEMEALKQRNLQNADERQARDAAAALNQQRLERENADMRRRLADLEARLNGGEPTAENLAPHPSAAEEGEPVAMVGKPNANWTMTQLEEYAAAEGIPLPESGNRLRTLGKTRVIEMIADVQRTRNHPDFAED